MEEKNICGTIPIGLHEKVRREIERDEITTKEFLRKVIEEHFMEKGVDHMAARTVAVQVSEELFKRLKWVVAKKKCKQKDFLLEIIESAIAREEEEILQQELKEEESPHGEDIEEPEGEEPEGPDLLTEDEEEQAEA